MDKLTNIQKETRNLYLEHHKNYINNKDLFDRHYKYSVDPSNYALAKDWFKNKKVVDIGCGNNGVFQKAFYDLGCDSITCLDLGDEWIPLLKSVLVNLNINLSKFNFISGTATKLPFESNYFDFAGSFGVLMHLESLEEMKKSVNEMLRVIKSGGICSADFGYGNTGILNNFINPALRKAYLEDDKFSNYIDNLDLNSIKDEFKKILLAGLGKDELITKDLIGKLVNLITPDTINYFQDVLRVPVQLGSSVSEDLIMKILIECGAKNIKRCPEFYYKRNDFRRFLTPFHVSRETSDYSKIMFGPGNLRFTWSK